MNFCSIGSTIIYYNLHWYFIFIYCGQYSISCIGTHNTMQLHCDSTSIKIFTNRGNSYFWKIGMDVIYQFKS